MMSTKKKERKKTFIDDMIYLTCIEIQTIEEAAIDVLYAKKHLRKTFLDRALPLFIHLSLQNVF
jgi:hypothetical protein